MKNLFKKTLRLFALVVASSWVSRPVYSMFDVHYLENKKEHKYLCMILLSKNINNTSLQALFAGPFYNYLKGQDPTMHWSFFLAKWKNKTLAYNVFDKVTKTFE